MAAGLSPEYSTPSGPSRVCSSLRGSLSSSCRSCAVSFLPLVLSCILIALSVLLMEERQAGSAEWQLLLVVCVCRWGDNQRGQVYSLCCFEGVGGAEGKQRPDAPSQGFHAWRAHFAVLSE